MEVNGVNTSNYNAKAFRGKWSKNENGTPYYKTNTGTIAGSILAVPAAAYWLWGTRKLPVSKEELLKQREKDIKAMEEALNSTGLMDRFKQNIEKLDPKLFEHNKFIKKFSIPLAAAAALCTLGCGVLTDKLRNKKAGETAEVIKQTGVKNALASSDNIAISKKRHPYYESNNGIKYGAALGAGCGIIHSFMENGKANNIQTIILKALGFALGGLVLGAITDKYTNNDAKKNV